MGDVIATIFALGYHEQFKPDETISVRRKDLRRAALARIYSADKNVSVFLGRPFRLSFRVCKSQLPLLETENQGLSGDASSRFQTRWPSDHQYEPLTETRWSALCAILKEMVTNLADEPDAVHKEHRAS
jgi:hypothetical protein